MASQFLETAKQCPDSDGSVTFRLLGSGKIFIRIRPILQNIGIQYVTKLLLRSSSTHIVSLWSPTEFICLNENFLSVRYVVFKKNALVNNCWETADGWIRIRKNYYVSWALPAKNKNCTKLTRSGHSSSTSFHAHYQYCGSRSEIICKLGSASESVINFGSGFESGSKLVLFPNNK